MKRNFTIILSILLLVASGMLTAQGISIAPQEEKQIETPAPLPPPAPTHENHKHSAHHDRLAGEPPHASLHDKHKHSTHHDRDCVMDKQTAPEIRDFFQNLKKNNPDEYNRLVKLRIENRGKFLQELSKAMPSPMRETERRIAELEKKCWKLARELKKTNDETKKAELTEELRKTTTEIHDLLIDKTDQHIKEMNQRLKFFQDNREKILAKKLNFFLNLPQPPKKR